MVRKIKARLQQRIEGEHEKAKQSKQHSHEEGPMTTFQKHWITSGAAVFTKHGPQVTLLSPSQDREPPLSGGVHIRTVARGRKAGQVSGVAGVGEQSRRRWGRGAQTTGRREGAYGGGDGQTGPKRVGYTAHRAVDPPGGYLGGPGVRKHVPIKRQQGDDHSGECYGPE